MLILRCGYRAVANAYNCVPQQHTSVQGHRWLNGLLLHCIVLHQGLEGFPSLLHVIPEFGVVLSQDTAQLSLHLECMLVAKCKTPDLWTVKNN